MALESAAADLGGGIFSFLASGITLFAVIFAVAGIVLIPLFFFVVKPMLDKKQYPYKVNIFEQRTNLIKPLNENERAGRFKVKESSEETFKLYKAKVPIGPISSEYITPDNEINLYSPSKGIYIPCKVIAYNRVIEVPYYKVDSDNKPLLDSEGKPIIDHIEHIPHFDNQMLLQLSEDKEMKYWATTKMKEIDFLHPTSDWLQKWLPIIMVAMMLAVVVILLIFGGQAMEKIAGTNQALIPVLDSLTEAVNTFRDTLSVATINGTTLLHNVGNVTNVTAVPIK